MKSLLLIILFILSACAGTPEPHYPATPEQSATRSTPSPTPDTSQRSRITAIVRNMIGAPYQYGGTTPSGFDCSGLVWYSHKKAGIAVPRTASQQYKTGKKVSAGNMKPGDLLFFRIHNTRTLHVATYVGKRTFVHAPSSGKKVRTEKLDNPYWSKRLIGSRRFY